MKTGIGTTTPTTDLEIVGVVHEIEEALYSYADVRDDNYVSMLTIPLLAFVGKRVRIRVELIKEAKT